MADYKSREVGCGNDTCYCTGACDGHFDVERVPFDKERSKPTSDLTVTLTADVSEFITGVKAAQRELRELTKAVREYEEAVDGVDITLDGKALGRALEPTISEEQARKELIKRRYGDHVE